MKQQVNEEKTVKSIDWVPNTEMLADVLTKANVNTNHILETVTTGRL